MQFFPMSTPVTAGPTPLQQIQPQHYQQLQLQQQQQQLQLQQQQQLLQQFGPAPQVTASMAAGAAPQTAPQVPLAPQAQILQQQFQHQQQFQAQLQQQLYYGPGDLGRPMV